MPVQKFRTANQHSRNRVFLLKVNFGLPFQFEPGNPWLHSPDRVKATLLEERQLIRIGCRDNLYAPAELRNPESLRAQPHATRYILCVSKFWCSDFFPAKIRCRFDTTIALHEQRCTASRSAANHTH